MPYTSILAEMAGSWWTFLLRGIAAVLFAVMAFLWPGLTLAVLVIFWGAFALVDGIVASWREPVPGGGRSCSSDSWASPRG